MPTYVVAGTEDVEIAPAFFKEEDADSVEWIKLSYVSEDNPPLYTKNADTITTIRSLEKNGDTITLSTKGDPNVLTVGINQQPPEIMALIDNIEYSEDTTKIIELSDRKLANLAFRLTSLPVKDGRKLITIIPNTDVTNTTPGGGANNSVQQILLNATIGTFETTLSKKRAIAIKRWVKADGTPIDSSEDTTPVVTPTP